MRTIDPGILDVAYGSALPGRESAARNEAIRALLGALRTVTQRRAATIASLDQGLRREPPATISEFLAAGRAGPNAPTAANPGGPGRTAVAKACRHSARHPALHVGIGIGKRSSAPCRRIGRIRPKINPRHYRRAPATVIRFICFNGNRGPFSNCSQCSNTAHRLARSSSSSRCRRTRSPFRKLC